ITADEIVAAGGKNGSENMHYYLYKNSNGTFWSFSPYHDDGIFARLFMVNSKGTLGGNGTIGTCSIAPVIK
ncbi:MAG TPA: hypothetical protein DCY94_01835, partial [Firmicutes bacterium]|nr:hypothetical protein [Bacillota bacterium]